MNQLKYQIFLSSTYSDLIEARNKVIEIILKMHHFPVGMEMFSADDSEQWEVIKDTISSSDYYVLIIGHRYGSETKEGISYTEKELEFAIVSKVPVLSFIRQRDVATKPHERDTNYDKTIKLNNLIEKASKSKMCDFWANPDELSAKVAVALQKIFIKYPRVGWIRSDKGYSAKLSEELATLSKENRDMRDEIQLLRGDSEPRKPLIKVTINERNSIKHSIPLLDDAALGVIRYPEPIDITRIPSKLKEYISDESIIKYNDSLPTKEELDSYNTRISYFNMVQKSYCDLSIAIENNGKRKATEVYVEIDFPEDILLLRKDVLTDMKAPKNPMPKDIIKIAEEKYRKEKILRLSPIKAWGEGLPKQDLYIIPDLFKKLDIPPVYLSNYPRDNWAEIEKNKIVIKVGSLLHTREIEFEDFIIVPRETGEYRAILTIMCAEYEDKETVEFPIIVDQLTTG